jgi:hypothetical protein
MESLYRMAILAAIAIGRTLELAHMDIFVAVGAGCELKFVNRVLTCWRMTLGAFNGRVLSLERILRLGVAGDIEESWFESRDGVTGYALSFVRTLRKLTIMWIAVTRGTLLKRDRLSEIPVLMTL